MQEEAQVLLEFRMELNPRIQDEFDYYQFVACILYCFQPRMRGWFPRRCAVEAVDHYDSCQVFGILHFVILLLSFSNMLTHFRLERERIAVKKQINSPKRKAERQRKRNEEENEDPLLVAVP